MLNYGIFTNLCFVGFECKRSKSSKKIIEKMAKVEMSRHNFKGTIRKNVVTKENYALTKNGRAMRQVKTI